MDKPSRKKKTLPPVPAVEDLDKNWIKKRKKEREFSYVE